MARLRHVVAPAPSEPALRPAVPSRSASSTTRRALAVTVLLVCAAAVLVLRTFVASPVQVASASMEPTLRAGDVVLVDRRSIRVEDLAHGDLVTFANPGSGTETLKRVVGVPGDQVVILDAVLHVNGVPVEEPYVDFSEWEGMFTAQVQVPDGGVYVLGDNRVASVDSRDFGPVDAAAINGRVLLRLWPLPGSQDVDVARSAH